MRKIALQSLAKSAQKSLPIFLQPIDNQLIITKTIKNKSAQFFHNATSPMLYYIYAAIGYLPATAAIMSFSITIYPSQNNHNKKQWG